MHADGKTPATANFLSGMLKAIPPLEDLFRQAGMSLPDHLKGIRDKGKDAPADEVITTADETEEKILNPEKGKKDKKQDNK